MKKLLDDFYKERLTALDELVEDDKEIKTRVNKLEDAVDDLASYTRRNNLIVYGVPLQDEERAEDLAVKLSGIVGIKVQPHEIDMAHQLPTRNKNAT